MQLNKEQRRTAHAARQNALKTYFTGDGAPRRTFRFVHKGLLSAGTWFARCLLFASWAVIAGLLIGPEHDMFLAKAYSWATAMPLKELSAALHSGARYVAGELATVSLAAGFLEQLMRVGERTVEPYAVMHHYSAEQP